MSDFMKWLMILATLRATEQQLKTAKSAPVVVKGIKIGRKSYTLTGTVSEE